MTMSNIIDKQQIKKLVKFSLKDLKYREKLKSVVKMVENVGDSVQFEIFSQYIYENQDCSDSCQSVSDKNENDDSREQKELLKQR